MYKGIKGFQIASNPYNTFPNFWLRKKLFFTSTKETEKKVNDYLFL